MLVRHWLHAWSARAGSARSASMPGASTARAPRKTAGLEDTFLAHALAWFGVQCEPTLSPWDKAAARRRCRPRTHPAHPRRHRATPIPARPDGRPTPRSRRPEPVETTRPQSQFGEVRKSKPKSETNCLCLVTTREPLTTSPISNAVKARRGAACSAWTLAISLKKPVLHCSITPAPNEPARRKSNRRQRTPRRQRRSGRPPLTLNLLGRFLARPTAATSAP